MQNHFDWKQLQEERARGPYKLRQQRGVQIMLKSLNAAVKYAKINYNNVNGNISSRIPNGSSR